MDIIARIAEELQIRKGQAEAAVKLIDEGNTIPFIARYRKEATGSLNDEQLRNLGERLTYLRNLEEKKEQILGSISEQGLLTEELEKQIREAMTMVALEDLYRPYRPKRKTRASVAKERGLEPLAQILLAQETADMQAAALPFVNEEKEVPTPEDALQGAMDILAEQISDTAEIRAKVREMTFEEGVIVSKAKDAAAAGVYEMYAQYSEAVKKIPGHRVLALNRGENEKVLSVSVEAPEERILLFLEKKTLKKNAPAEPTELLKTMLKDSYDRLLSPAIERDIRNELTEKAEDGAISVFGKNLEQILMQPPIAGKVVMGWDPAFRTGCKLAIVDATGKVLDTKVIYPTAPQNKVEEAKAECKRLIKKYGVNVISVGNGTASRESEQVIVDLIKEMGPSVSLQYVIVNEAGASVYSASKLATEEFPQFDVGQRSAASIARRLQDPLAELVKIDPRSIGVGQYQHDMNQKKLGNALEGVVEVCVNKVGVDLNTASAPLLQYISGISKPIAKNIVAYREKYGRFTSRKQLLKVDKLGPKAFEQCAGFLRIWDGENPLDATAVHPEMYAVAEIIMENGGPSKFKTPAARKFLADELFVGEITLEDILKELEKPSRDPREDMPAPILRSDVLSMEDLKPGMILKGTVRNVIDFGCFVDIGVHQDGLVHISQICDRYIKHPLEAVKLGDVVEVQVLNVDLAKKRIGLTMRIQK